MGEQRRQDAAPEDREGAEGMRAYRHTADPRGLALLAQE
jgi:hypothetical protein